jgi:hypothetical protein
MTIGVCLATAVARAAPPAPGQHFDCGDGGTSSCAADDTGCVSNTLNHLKCSSKIAKLLGKAVSTVIVCHVKQAGMRFKGSSANGAGMSEENCEDNPGNSAKGKLDAGLSGLASSGLCDPSQLTGAAGEEAILFGPGPLSLDAQNANVYCDSSSAALIGDDDTGWVAVNADMLKCEEAVGKALGKLAVSVIKCHDKMNASFFKAKDFDEEGCESDDPRLSALVKFDRIRDKLIAAGICPPCLNGAGQDAQATSVISQIDAGNAVAYPCGLP